ncbi:hypothetical protein C9374_003497 [Naegleria lovaniensis]|uniref:Uncharacterized protein n=1 Tax=Naegleria lovaniensis TaxID=51637 RepID=A0AA88GRG5_NAELO|nr:uncharacterized protein C9374_003497 [Naegleria lovaniensis]KAG2385682.1 hypothetical protein C9374_003497 [Naegleria lovaniensis]
MPSTRRMNSTPQPALAVKTTTPASCPFNFESMSFEDMMSAASQYTDNAFSFESSIYTSSATSTPNNKKRKTMASSSASSYEEFNDNCHLSNDRSETKDEDELSLEIPSTKKSKIVESYTANMSPTKKQVPLIRLSEKKTQEAFPTDPLKADTSSISALSLNMKDCFSHIENIMSELNNDETFGSLCVSSNNIFSKADMDHALSLLNQ